MSAGAAPRRPGSASTGHRRVRLSATLAARRVARCQLWELSWAWRAFATSRCSRTHRFAVLMHRRAKSHRVTGASRRLRRSIGCPKYLRLHLCRRAVRFSVLSLWSAAYHGLGAEPEPSMAPAEIEVTLAVICEVNVERAPEISVRLSTTPSVTSTCKISPARASKRM